MKETTKRFLSFVLAFVMVLGLMPVLSLNASATGEVSDAPDNVDTNESAVSEELSSEDDLMVTAEEDYEEPLTVEGMGPGTAMTTKTIYKLVSSLTAGKEYLIVNSNSAGNNRYALAGNTTGVGVTVKAVDTISDTVYIEDKGDALEWTASAGWQFSSGDYKLGYSDGLVFTEADNWSYSSSYNCLYTTVGGSIFGSSYYLRYDNGWSVSSNYNNVYLYQKTDVQILTNAEVEGVYSIAGDPERVKVAVDERGGTATLGSVLTFTPDNGSDATTTDTSKDATYEIIADPDGITSGINGNTVTLTGVHGEALVKVSYYVDGTDLVTNYITVVADADTYITPEDGTNDFPEYPNEGAIRFDKNATGVGNFSESGMAKVELSMTGVPYSTNNEIDVVIMVDMSGSMEEDASTNGIADRVQPAKDAVIAALNAIVKNEDGTYNNSRVAIYTFSGSLNPNNNGYCDLQTFDANSVERMTNTINNWKANGGTNYKVSLQKCQTVLNAAKTDGIGNEREQYCIFITDGSPSTGFTYLNSSGRAQDMNINQNFDDDDVGEEFVPKTEYYSYMMKQAGVDVYTIGVQMFTKSGYNNITESTNCKTLLKKIAGNDQGDATTTANAGYARFVEEDVSALTQIFKDIVNEIKEAATNVVVEDKIGNNYNVSFKLPNQNVTVHETNGMTEFYIQVLEYQLNENKERTGTPAVLENFTFDANGALKSHSVDGEVTCEGQECTHVTFFRDIVTNINGTYFEYTCGPATDAAGNEILDEMGNTVTEEFLTWKADKLTTTELALEYFVYLNYSAGYDIEQQIPADTYETNEYADITYDNFQGNRVQQELPVPSMTWNGAQVTYVFYLVNENGEPVNRAGRVIPFAEAIYVTEPVKENVVWYGDNSKTELSAAYLASQIVPDVYALYDPNAYYEIDVYQTEGVDTGSGVNYNHFIIEGSTTGLASYTTTKVFNTKSGAKYDQYGAYSNTTGTYVSTHSGTSYNVTDATNMDYANTTVAFAVVWKPQLAEDVVVVDFGLDVVIDVTTNDNMVAELVGVRTDAPANVTINSGTYTADKADTADVMLGGMKIGTATLEDSTSVRFSLDKDNGMLLNNAAVFYYESDVSYFDAKNDLKTASMYSSVTVIPATTVYYEDNFVDYTSFTWSYEKDEDGNEIGWVASDKNLWTLDGVTVGGTQAEDRPGENKISDDLDADNIYGFDGAYSTMSLHSNGSAAKATVDYNNYAQASFEFWGTGFDIISLTSNTTGVILVDVEKEGEDGWAEFDNFMVDTYYGYKQVQCHVRYRSYTATDGKGNFIEGAYEWVRKEILHEANKCDGSCELAGELPEKIEKAGEELIVSETVWLPCEAENSIYQVPVIKMADEEYGHYRVTIKATYDSFFDHVGGSDSYDFYLDAIRIYDPANDGANNKDIEDAYVADHEGWPSYIELRNQLIEAAELKEAGKEAVIEGVVFIDGDASVELGAIGSYVSYGPNNEVYLAAGQSVAFLLDTPANLDRVHIGIKSADGKVGTYTIKNVGADGKSTNEKDFTVSTATDLYYDLTGWKDGIIVITNSGNQDEGAGIISITNIKSTYTTAPTAKTSTYMTAEAAELVLNAMKPVFVNPFADVQKYQFFYESVLWAVENGITNGVSDTHFGPFMYCNRAQVVTFLWRAAGSPEPISGVNPFADVKESDFFYKAVLWAVENGITTGMTADTFGPNALCNRAQVVTFLWRANGSVVCDAENPFADVAADAFYHDAVIWAVENGITTGTAADAFDPNGSCMRAHVVTFLYRAYQLPEHSEI